MKYLSNSAQQFAKKLLNVNTPDQLSMLIRTLLGVTNGANLTLEKATALFRTKKVKFLSHHITNASDALEVRYIQPEELLNIASNLSPTYEKSLIKHGWSIGKNIDFATAGTYSSFDALTYVGETDDDVQKLGDFINTICPVVDEHYDTVPLVILMPENGKRTDEQLQNDAGSWKVININKTHFASQEAKIATIGLFQVLGLKDSFTVPLLKQLDAIEGNKSSDTPLVSIADKFDAIVDKPVNAFMVDDNDYPAVVNFTSNKVEKFDCVISDRLVDKIERVENDTLEPSSFYHEKPTATETDLTGIRKTLSYLLSQTSGTAVILNVPIGAKMMLEKLSTPTIIAPPFWCKAIRSVRPLNNKKRSVPKPKKSSTNDKPPKILSDSKKQSNSETISENEYLHDLMNEILGKNFKIDDNSMPRSFIDSNMKVRDKAHEAKIKKHQKKVK
ncbi:MAG: hypothetical protein P8M49_13600 [Thalassotalea sp.]|nr:hypothetical protein [Thalassotalea sp.]MDG2394545.1 hypothetical protein [Thalassotalea sp.]